VITQELVSIAYERSKSVEQVEQEIKSVLFYLSCGRIFSRVRPFYERVVSDLELQRSMSRSLTAPS
jgi:hypothetical protein